MRRKVLASHYVSTGQSSATYLDLECGHTVSFFGKRPWDCQQKTTLCRACRDGHFPTPDELKTVAKLTNQAFPNEDKS